MQFSPILLLHICGGTAGLFSGAAAMSFRKGSRRHRIAGNIFVISMLIMASGAVYLGNVFGGALTCSPVTTAWLTARRRDRQTRLFDWGALLVALVIGAAITTDGIAKASGRIVPNGRAPMTR